MDDKARREADTVFRRALVEFGEPEKSNTVQFAALDIGDSICDMAPRIIKTAFGVLDTFGFLIPNRVEGPIRALLTALREVIMPTFCGIAGGGAAAPAKAGPETVQKKG